MLGGTNDNLAREVGSEGGTPDGAAPDHVGCFAAGTRIRTIRGDVAVEDLAVGDFVVTFSGKTRSILGLSHQTIDCRRHRTPESTYPVRVSAHAFGDGRPERDLLVAPDQLLCVNVLGEVLIPAIAIVNTSTIAQQEVDAVTYWRVALEDEDILLAEEMPAASEPATIRERSASVADAMDAEPTHSRAFAHRPVYESGPVTTAVREQLSARAERLGWRRERPERLGDLHLVVDGRRVDPLLHQLSARFTLPADAREVWMISLAGRPDVVKEGSDDRTLGVPLKQLVIDDGFAEPRVTSADDGRFIEGFNDVDGGGHRWSTGRARLPAELWDGVRGDFFLRVDLVGPALPRWIFDPLAVQAPAAARPA